MRDRCATRSPRVGCLVVDEIHLLGDPVRGAVLEALRTRVREDGAGARIVGLSATVANADEVAEWLGARPVRTAWRPTRLTWQLPVLPTADEADWAARAAVRTEAAVRIARGVGADGGSVLVFCGSKRRVRATGLALAADRGAATTGVDADDAELVERLCTKAGGAAPLPGLALQAGRRAGLPSPRGGHPGRHLHRRRGRQPPRPGRDRRRHHHRPGPRRGVHGPADVRTGRPDRCRGAGGLGVPAGRSGGTGALAGPARRRIHGAVTTGRLSARSSPGRGRAGTGVRGRGGGAVVGGDAGRAPGTRRCRTPA